TASYPVAQGYRPPPLEQKAATLGWAFPVALGAMAAFLVVGVVLLVQCLGSEPDAPSAEEELPAKSAQINPNASGFKLGVEFQSGPILVYEVPSTPKQQQAATDPPNSPKPVSGQQPKAEPQKPTPP